MRLVKIKLKFMKNNQKGFANIILPIVVLVLVLIAGYFLLSKKSTQISDTTPEWKTYTNTQYGFSFNYPTSWQLSEKIAKDGRKYVDLSSGVFSDPQIPEVPTEEIMFFTVDKNYFNPPIPTKVGFIGYDPTRNALVDIDTSKCLSTSPLFKTANAPLGFSYGGSLMSTPAHFEFALLTQNGSIILVNEYSLSYSTDIENIKSKIATSFSLLSSNSIFVPNCAVQ